MASSDPEIKDGFPIPVWMKSKPTKEFEPFAASPPAPEDSFFFIRYPGNDIRFGNKPENFGQANVEQELPKIDLTSKTKGLSAVSYNVKEKDWSKHTKPCQDVLHGIQPINTAANPASVKPKPAGTDDGFKGEGAACGNSVVKVANQMISSGRSPRGFTVASPEEDAVPPEAHQYNLMARRGSKSLPTTPIQSPNSSPTSRRKKIGNRYFTSPFEPVADGSSRSWLTMALLGLKKDFAASTSTLTEEDDIAPVEHRLQGVSLAQSVENLGPAPAASRAPPSHPAKPAQPFRPKPSELREMNFWSPTSM